LSLAFAAALGVTRFVGHLPLSASAMTLPFSSTATAPPGFAPAAKHTREASVAYEAGVESFRQGGRARARANWEHALAIDPGYAAAALQLGIQAFVDHPELARESLHRAAFGRANLGERDRALLDAVTPWILREPSDAKESARRMQELAERMP